MQTHDAILQRIKWYQAPGIRRHHCLGRTVMPESFLLGIGYTGGRQHAHVLLETDVKPPGFSPPVTTLQRHLASGLRLVGQPRHRLADCYYHKVRVEIDGFPRINTFVRHISNSFPKYVK